MGSKNQFKRYGHMKIWEKNNKNLHKVAAQKYVWLLKWSMWNDQLKYVDSCRICLRDFFSHTILDEVQSGQGRKCI